MSPSKQQHLIGRFRRLAFALVAVVAAACAAAAVSAATDTSAGPGDYRVAAVSDLQAKTIAALGRDQQPGDAIDTPAAGPFAANPQLARKVDTAAGPAWIIPADRHTCLRASDGGDAVWTCVTDADAAAGRLLLTLRGADERLVAVYGVVPAGGAGVQFANASGTSAVDTSEDAFGVKTSIAKALVFVDAQGEQHKVALP